MSRERPILMSGPMVRAILAGTKTQTRRTVRVPAGYIMDERDDGTPWPWHASHAQGDTKSPWLRCPYGEAGDLLWVRETHALAPRTAYAQSEGVQQTVNPADPDQAAVYREGWERVAPGRWRSPIHMPRWASRITLRVTSVRVEKANPWVWVVGFERVTP